MRLGLGEFEKSDDYSREFGSLTDRQQARCIPTRKDSKARKEGTVSPKLVFAL